MIIGVGLGKVILSLVKRDLINNGHNKLWCHGPENMVSYFSKWSNAKPIKTLHTFGRKEIKDVKMIILLKEEI